MPRRVFSGAVTLAPATPIASAQARNSASVGRRERHVHRIDPERRERGVVHRRRRRVRERRTCQRIEPRRRGCVADAILPIQRAADLSRRRVPGVRPCGAEQPRTDAGELPGVPMAIASRSPTSASRRNRIDSRQATDRDGDLDDGSGPRGAWRLHRAARSSGHPVKSWCDSTSRVRRPAARAPRSARHSTSTYSAPSRWPRPGCAAAPLRSVEPPAFPRRTAGDDHRPPSIGRARRRRPGPSTPSRRSSTRSASRTASRARRSSAIVAAVTVSTDRAIARNEKASSAVLKRPCNFPRQCV